MPTLTFSPGAAVAVQRHADDPVLFDKLRRELLAIADDLNGRAMTPTPFPHPPTRRVVPFQLKAGDLSVGGFTAVFAEVPNDEVKLTVLYGAPSGP